MRGRAICFSVLLLAGLAAAQAPGDAVHLLEVGGGWEHAAAADSPAPDGSPEGWQAVKLPHTPAAASPWGLYRVSFAVPGAWAGSRVCLIVRPLGGAVRLWLNGQFLGARAPSALDIRLDASAAVRPGAGNRLLIALSGAEGTDGAGLAACWLEATGALGIERLTPSPWCLPQGAVLDVALEVANGTRERFEGKLELALKSPADGRQPERIWRRGSDVRADPGRSASVALSLEAEAPRLWRFDDPFLYRLTAELRSRENQTLRTAGRPLGIRHTAAGQGRLFSNGEWVRLAAVAVPARGATLLCTQPGQAEALAERLAGGPAPLDELLGFCDQAGIVALLDAPACPPDTPGWGETLDALAAEAVLHPCVWGWVLRGDSEAAAAALARLRERMPRVPIGRMMPCTETEAKGCDFLLGRFATRAGREDDDGYGRRLDDLLRAAADKAIVVVDRMAEASDKGRADASLAHRLREAERRGQLAILAFELDADAELLGLAAKRLCPYRFNPPSHEARLDRGRIAVRTRFEVHLASPVFQRLPCYALLGGRVAWRASRGEALIAAGGVPLSNAYPCAIEGGAQPARGETEWRSDEPGDLEFAAELHNAAGRVLASHAARLSLRVKDGRAELNVQPMTRDP